MDIRKAVALLAVLFICMMAFAQKQGRMYLEDGGINLTPADFEVVDFREVYSSATGSVNVDDYNGSSFTMIFGPEDTETPAEYYASDTSVHAYAGGTIAITGADDISDVIIDFAEGTADGANIDIQSERAVVRFSKPCQFTSITVSYKSLNRESAVGMYGTVCAPYKIAASGATLYSASLSSGNASVVLKEVTETIAGYPYIFLATEGNQLFSCISESVDTPVSTGCLVGTFEDIPAPDGSYVLQTHTDEDNNRVQRFYLVDISVAQPRVTANRAYLKHPSTNADGEVKSVAISWSESAAINAMSALVSGKADVYDINGRKLSRLQKGINIVDGVKVLVR